MPTQQFVFEWPIYKLFLRRYRWLLIGLLVLAILLAVGVQWSMLNLYTVTATIFISPEQELRAIIGDRTTVTPELQSQMVKLRHIIGSAKFIETNIVQELHVRLRDVSIPPWRLPVMAVLARQFERGKNLVARLAGLPVYEPPTEEQQLLRALGKQLKLEPQSGVLLRITYSGPNQAVSKRIVETAARQGINFLLGETGRETRGALAYINTEYRKIEQRLADLENQLAEKQVEQFDKGSEAKIAIIQQHQESRDQLRITRRNVDALNLQHQETILLKDQRRALLLSAPEFMKQLAAARHPLVVELEQKEQELQVLLDIYTSAWPPVQQLEQEIAALKSTISSLTDNADATEEILLTDQLYNQYVDQIAQLDSQIQTLQNNEQFLLENIALYEERLKSMPEFQKSLVPIQREIDLNTRQLEELATQRDRILRSEDLQSKLAQLNILSVTDPIPTGLSGTIIAMIIALVSPALGMGLIGFLYYANTTVKHAGDVHRELNLPVLAVIPNAPIRHERKNARRRLQYTPLSPPTAHPELPVRTETCVPEPLPFDDLALKQIPLSPRPQFNEWGRLTALHDPDTRIAEEYQRLGFETNLRLQKAWSGATKLIMVSSALPGEGKTLTACNLAVTLAQEHRVLLVDFNFRQPAVHRFFGVPFEPGIASLLAHDGRPEVFRRTDSPNLNILPAGKMPHNLVGALNSTTLTQFFEGLKRTPYFEYVIVDMPSFSPCPDVAIVAPKMDAILWVIRELRTPKAQVQAALRQIAHLPILGVILNGSMQLVPTQS